MQKRFIRIYKEMDLTELKEHLLIYGALSASCANCQALDLKLDAIHCPQCKTDFRYIAFRDFKSHAAKIPRILAERPYIILVDHDDFSRNWGASKAQEFLR